MPELEALDPARLDVLTDALTDLKTELETWREVPPWSVAFYEAIGLLLMYFIASAESDKKSRRRNVTVAARSVVERLAAESPSGAWRVAFQANLKPASRAGVLAAPMDGRAIGHAELVWWTARCRFEHGADWCQSENVETVEAVRELSESATAYIRLLQTEPSRRSMESFFESMGTTSEDEILATLQRRDELTAVEDTLRAEMTTWLLRRYSLLKSCRLLKGTFSKREMIGAWTSLFLTELGLFLFLLQTLPRIQVQVQFAAFVVFVFSAPRILSMLLPRALFGTLLAWLTVVLAQTASLLPIVSTDRDIHNACHLWLTQVVQPRAQLHHWVAELGHGRFAAFPAVLEFAGMIVAGSLISIIFLKIEVQSRLATKSGSRSTLCFFVMLFGSLFWGAMLVPMLQYIIAREPLGSQCACIYPAWLLGSVCAVAFGILVQLMWDDHAVGDSIGLPAEGIARIR
jgi:predicted outer membrane lipoprotein